MNNSDMAQWCLLPTCKQAVKDWEYRKRVQDPSEEIFWEIEQASNNQISIHPSDSKNSENIDAFFTGFTEFKVGGEADQHWQRVKAIKATNKKAVIAKSIKARAAKSNS